MKLHAYSRLLRYATYQCLLHSHIRFEFSTKVQPIWRLAPAPLNALSGPDAQSWRRTYPIQHVQDCGIGNVSRLALFPGFTGLITDT